MAHLEHADALAAWVEEGGGLLTLAGYTADEMAVKPASDLLEPLGLGYEYVGFGAGILGEGDPPTVVPVPAGSASPVLNNVSAVGVFFAYPVVGSGSILLESGGYTLAMSQEQLLGRAIAYADDYLSLVSEWPLLTQLDQEVFLTNVLTWLAEPSGCAF